MADPEDYISDMIALADGVYPSPERQREICASLAALHRQALVVTRDLPKPERDKYHLGFKIMVKRCQGDPPPPVRERDLPTERQRAAAANKNKGEQR